VGDPFDTFIKEMLSAKQWNTAVDEDVRAQLEDDLKNRLMDQIDRAVVEAMPEEKVDGLNELLDAEAPEDQVQQYIAQSGVDVQRVTLETMLRFRELYLGATEA
jgi:hypothetical protein